MPWSLVLLAIANLACFTFQTLDPSILQNAQMQFFNQPFSRSPQSVSNPFSETTSEQSESHATKNESITEGGTLLLIPTNYFRFMLSLSSSVCT